jgi:exosome complex component MTR3
MKLNKLGDTYRFEFPHETIIPVAEPLSENTDNTARSQGRSANQLRQMYIKSGIVSQAPGSAYIEMENCKVICSVYGPKQSTSDFYSPKGKLSCDFKFATFSQNGKRRSHLPEKDTQELELIIVNALEPAIQLETFPKSIIEINILVLEADGGVLGGCITAASLALVDAGILAFDMVAACSVSLNLKYFSLLDPTEQEERKQIANVTVAYMPSLQEITHVLLSGDMNVNSSLESVDLCIAGCKQIYEMMKKHLLEKPTKDEKSNAFLT